jgi:hypothetical protein
MSRTVTANVRYLPDRSVSVTVDGPDGPMDAGVTRRSSEIGPMAQRVAELAFTGSPVQVQLRVEQPPWLREGMLVEVAATALDPEERPTFPYGQVMGFVAVGGVLVMHPETGAGVFAPEDLTAVNPDLIPRAALDGITERTGVSPSARRRHDGPDSP